MGHGCYSEDVKKKEKKREGEYWISVERVIEEDGGPWCRGGVQVEDGVEEEDLIDSMRALEIAHFAEVSASGSDSAILLSCMLRPLRCLNRYRP